MSTRVYVGRLPYHATERDLEYFFRGYGKINEIMLKQGYAFVEFSNYRDADDACHDLHGRDLQGGRVAVELARGTPRGRDRFEKRIMGGMPEDGVPMQPRPRNTTQTQFRCKVENLSSRVTWQELKDMFRGHALVTYADAHTAKKREGIVEFASEKDMRAGIKKFNKVDMHGRRIRIISPPGADAKKRSRSRSTSHSSGSEEGSPKKRKRSRNDSNKSADDVKPKSKSRSRSKSKSRSRSRSRSHSDRNEERSRSRSPGNQ